jgi:hypothetical protein
MESIQKKRVNSLRKLNEKRQKVINEDTKRDIIQEYADFSSKIYAPKLRDGAQVDRAQGMLRVQIDELNEYLGIEKLEAQIPDHVFNASTERRSDMTDPNSSTPAYRVVSHHFHLIFIRKSRCSNNWISSTQDSRIERQ